MSKIYLTIATLFLRNVATGNILAEQDFLVFKKVTYIKHMLLTPGCNPVGEGPIMQIALLVFVVKNLFLSSLHLLKN